MQIVELEAQCKEADQEKQKNAQLSVKVQELEAELRDKEQVRRPDHRLSIREITAAEVTDQLHFL